MTFSTLHITTTALICGLLAFAAAVWRVPRERWSDVLVVAVLRADRRLKGIRDNGDVRAGARVSAEVSVVFDHLEPRSDHLPDCLDLSVPDDQRVASALLLQSAHPASMVVVATSDLNLQTKLAAVRLPHIEPSAAG